MNHRTLSLTSFGFALATIVVAFAFFAALTSPITDTKAKSDPVGKAAATLNHSPHFGAVVCEPAQVLAVRRFPHDKRQPRPPRHRSERASSYTAELELTASLIDSITHDQIHRPLLSAFVLASPLSGHPLELLRPPAVCA
jgi:hypothetical protein